MVSDTQVRRLRSSLAKGETLTTAAAIDRLVHHSTILEVAGKSYRVDKAKMKMNEEK